MRIARLPVCCLLPVGLLSGATAVAAANDVDTTIRTTIVIRSKASDCPPHFVVFQLNSDKKMPRAPQICFVRTSAKPK
jgi:hypothetical protein